MFIRDLLIPSKGRIFFILLILIAANMPFIGSYHTEKMDYYCIQQKLIDCKGGTEREMHLNPIFWGPYAYITKGDSLGKTSGGEEEFIIPILELQKNPNYPGLAVNFLYWYLAAGLMIIPMAGKEEK